MGMVSELIVSVGVEGTDAVVGALKKIDGAQVELKDNTKTQTQSMGSSWTDFTVGLNQGLQLVQTVAGGIADIVNSFSDYNLAMEKGSIATGLMVDQYSRIIQAADDAFVSQDKMAKAMEMATKNGYPITIESLGQIADKLNAIKDPAEKAKLATEIFGRGWADIMPFLEQGSAGIEKATDAIKDNMIATDESVAKSKDYARAVDDLSDAWVGFRNEVGGAVIPVLTGAMKAIIDQASMADKFKTNVDLLNNAVKAGIISETDYKNAVMAGNYSIEAGVVATENLITKNNLLEKSIMSSGNAYSYMIDQGKQAAVDYAAIALEMEQRAKVQAELTKATGLTANFSNIVGFAKSYTEIQGQINEKQAQYDAMPGWKQASKDGKQLLTDIEALKQGYTDLANQMTLDMFQATIAVGGVTDAEMGAYLDMAVEMGFISQEGADAAIKAYNDAIGKINGMGIDEKTGNVVVDAAAAFATFDLIEAYAFADKTVRVMMKFIGGSGIGMESAGPWDAPGNAIGGPVYPGNVYNWQEPGREGEMLIPSQYGRVASSTEVAQMLREATRPGDGVAAGQQAQVVNNYNTEMTIHATVSSERDIDTLTREIVRRINK